MAKKEDIIYCNENKRNYFMLGGHFNFSGHIDMAKNYNKSEEIRKEHGYSEGSMFLVEIQESSRYKYSVVMYSKDNDQKVVKDAFELKNHSFWNFVRI